MFDKYRVDPGAMLQSMDILQDCMICLSGNHDTINDRDSIGSLEFLLKIMSEVFILAAPYGQAFYHRMHIDGTAIYIIPHVTTQQLFEDSLLRVYEAGQEDKATHKLLLLHCNFNYPEERLTQAELNLTEEDALALIEDAGFKIMIGHMHAPSEYFRGKLWVVGSTTNTGFADLSDKRSLLYDTKTGEVTSETHWRMKDHSLTLDAPTLTLGAFEVPYSNQTEFITLTGDIEPNQIHFLSQLHQRCWEEFPNLLALRDKTSMVSGEVTPDKISEVTKTQTFSQFLQARMPDDDMKALFKEVQNHAA